MLSKVSQRKSNVIWFHLYVVSNITHNKNELTETEIKLTVARREGVGDRWKR